jgi:Phasin protein
MDYKYIMINANVVAANKSAVDTGFRLMQVMFDSLEKFALLNMEAAKVLVHEGLANIQTVASSKDFGASGFQAGWQPMAGADRILGYSRNAYQIANETSLKVGDVLEQRLLISSQEFEEWVDAALAASPMGQSEAASTATKAALTNARTVIEQISKAAKEAAGYADANMKAAATATAEAVKGVAK